MVHEAKPNAASDRRTMGESTMMHIQNKRHRIAVRAACALALLVLFPMGRLSTVVEHLLAQPVFGAETRPAAKVRSTSSAASPADPDGGTCEASFSIPACTFDRGNQNVRVDLLGKSSWSDTAPVLHSKIHAPTSVEYDIVFPVDAKYTLNMLVAAAQARPVEVFVDGERVGTSCRGATGGWNASQAKWEQICQLRITKGKHTVKIFRELGFPHIVTLRFDSDSPLPAGWKPLPRALAETAATSNAMTASVAIPNENVPLVFVLAGQSNMVGQGKVEDLPEPLRTLPPNVTLYVDGSTMNLKQQGHFGPEVGIAQRLAEQEPKREIILFKFAFNGSSTLAWSPDYDAALVRKAASPHDLRAGRLYDKLVNAWKKTFAGHGDVRAAAFFWMQGESDARFPIAAEAHRQNLERIIAAARRDLGAPDTPFFLGEINPPRERDFPRVEKVTANLRSLAESLPRVFVISTFGISKRADEVHYDSAGQLELGRRFGRMFVVALYRGRHGPLNISVVVPKSPRPYVPSVDTAALRRAIRDLSDSFGDRYPRGQGFLARLDKLETKPADGEDAAKAAERRYKELVALHDEALLANPLLDFDELLLVKRRADSPRLGLPQNYDCNVALPRAGFEDEIAVLSLSDLGAPPRTLYKPRPARFVGDVDLHYDANRLLFSMPDEKGMWQVYELPIDGGESHALTGGQPDVHSFDACYLPDDGIVFCSTAYFNAIACTGGPAGVLYRMDGDGGNIRQLCFDQDQNWCPTVLTDGRVLYSRWEYTDNAHTHARLLFTMNPDGTQQMAHYGSNSYWPNAFFYARPVPGDPTKLISVIGGHHGIPRMGELVIFDPALGRRESSGAVQRIPGWGRKPERVMKDQLVDDSWPKFLHPWPLGDAGTDVGAGKYFLVAAQPAPTSCWGIYLVDVFDNMVLLKELPDFALLEPVPLKPSPRPPMVPSRIDLQNQTATVYISDIYDGRGLRDIPRGAVKSLRLVTYHYTYPGFRGVPGIIGIDGSWDPKRVLGTVPVEPDGSVLFEAPANTPISIQPLDGQGRALQLMRSWYTPMPGERVSCSGCHESRNSSPTSGATLALSKPPEPIRPWYGEVRGFSYEREVQPVIDRYCVGCHDGASRDDGRSIPDLRGTEFVRFHPTLPGNADGKGEAAEFSVSYASLHRLVRRPGHESDLHLLEPMEFHADNTELMQMLRKGHYGIELDEEAWDRLVTWIDLNCPFYGTRGEVRSQFVHDRRDSLHRSAMRRQELLASYAELKDNAEAIPIHGTGFYNSGKRIPRIEVETPPEKEPQKIDVPDWPFDSAEASRRQQEANTVTHRRVSLGKGQQIEMVFIPAGEFIMGSHTGPGDEAPPSCVSIDRPFWMSTTEITNGQYAVFDPAHDSRFESKPFCQYGVQGFPLNSAEQPVVRVSWHESMEFCRWLSKQAGLRFSLPTEAQWEYACRSGAATPFHYGDQETDFASWANMADRTLSKFVTDVWSVYDPPKRPPSASEDYLPKDLRFNDGSLLTVAPGRYQANPWGLFDMHGNVAEWTRTTYRPYPYNDADGRNDTAGDGLKVARGGSWRDRPHRCTSSYRLAYQPYQRVFNVGFRIVCSMDEL